MRTIDPKEAPVGDVFRYLLGGVAPRPIALVSTVASDGVVNLSPFSFFNAFSANPPIVIFSPSRRLRDNTIKDTYTNIKETRECVIQCVPHSLVEQVNLSSAHFSSEINEFEKSGLTPLDSVKVKAPRVKESPFQLECKLKQMIELGADGAAGNLAICEVLLLHISEDILNADSIDPHKIDLVARMGADYYSRASGDAVFQIAKPVGGAQVGIDTIPEAIRRSAVLTGNNLGQLGNVNSIPTIEQATELVKSVTPLAEANEESFYRLLNLPDHKRALSAALALERQGFEDITKLFELTAKQTLDTIDDRRFAWSVLLYAHRDK